MIDMLIYLIVLCIVGGLIYYLITMLPLPDPFKRIIMIAMILIFILILLSMFMGGISLPRWHQVSMLGGILNA